MKLINIREYYEKDGEYLPGKKVPLPIPYIGKRQTDRSYQGISLTVDQYRTLLKVIPEVNAGLKEAGIDVTDSATGVDSPPTTKSSFQKKTKAKKDKANIETTSEDE
jgi:hypothetical protein